GIVDDSTGSVIYAANLNADGFSFAKYIQNEINVPVHIANDADCAALGEYTRNGNGAKSFVLVTLGTGVGGGVVLNGRLYGGSNSVSCELGHMTLVSGSEKCSCGKRGCFEAYASVTALKRQTKAAMDKNPQSLMYKFLNDNGKILGKTAFRAADAGDSAAKKVVNRYLTYVADGIVSIENILQPDVIVIGGGISKEGGKLLKPVSEYADKYRFNQYTAHTEIKIASLFNNAGIVGAAMLCK
ncbi:MAG: ROK family protein, partial [Firmicutes bacterium]|nr:ROK family protein [Bacillota bacterium]